MSANPATFPEQNVIILVTSLYRTCVLSIALLILVSFPIASAMNTASLACIATIVSETFRRAGTTVSSMTKFHGD